MSELLGVWKDERWWSDFNMITLNDGLIAGIQGSLRHREGDPT